METLKQILIHTPWWVYIIFFYCIFIGIKAARGGVVSIWKMMIIPSIFLALSLHTLFMHFTLNLTVILTYTLSLICGVLLGTWQGHLQNITIDRQHHLLKLPGTWSTLIIILLIFCSKYYFGYAMAINPNQLHHRTFESSMLVISGLTCGLFIGRLIYYIVKLFTAPSVNLRQQ